MKMTEYLNSIEGIKDAFMCLKLGETINYQKIF